MTRLPRRGLVGALAALALALAAWTVPATSSAFTARVTNSTDTAGTGLWGRCATDLRALGTAYFIYGLTEASGSTTAADLSTSGANGTYRGAAMVSSTSALACPDDIGGAVKLDGSTNWVSPGAAAIVGPTTFSLIAWFSTTTKGGKLIGFGNSANGQSTSYDRHLYIDTNGMLRFGVYPGGVKTVVSANAVTDGNWHLAVATLSSAGMKLYVDGVLTSTGTDAGTTGAEGNASGYWHVGWDNTGGSWTSSGTSWYFNGRMRFAAALPTAITQADVTKLYNDGRPS